MSKIKLAKVLAEVFNPNPPMSQAIIENGGIVHTFKAHIVCAECTRFDNFEVDAESTTLDLFATAARRFFEKKDWHVGRPQTFCNDCFLGDECESCWGYGHVTAEGEPTIDRRCRKCGDCTGTGRIARTRGKEVLR